MIGVTRSSETCPNATLGMLGALSGAWSTWKGGKLDQFLRLDIPVHTGLSGGVGLRACPPSRRHDCVER